VRAFVNAIGFAAPGLETADALWAHMNGAALSVQPNWMAAPNSLPPRQMRRLSNATRLAILAAEQIGPVLPADAAWVFASSVGEGQTLDEILRSLRGPEILVQPIRFQNAVHNAAQGQWSIAAGAIGAASSIAAFDDTVGAGLLKAMMQIRIDDVPVGLVVYDAPLPEPLHPKRPFAIPMAAALALGSAPTDGVCAVLDIEMEPTGEATPPETAPVSAALSGCGNPVRFLLPLLAQIWSGDPGTVKLSLSGGACLRIAVSPADA